MNNIDKNIFNSYASVEAALLNDLATEARTKGKKARTLKGEEYYVKYDGVWHPVTPEQCRIHKLIRNNFNMFVEQLNSAKSDILGVWRTVWGERLPRIIADLEKGIEICQKYFDAFEVYIKELEEKTAVEETVEETDDATEEVSGENVTENVVNETSSDAPETIGEKTEEEKRVVEYRKVEGFDNYAVSSDGKVWSLNYNRTGKMKELKPRIGAGGYLDVALYTNGREVHKYVHRLVAEAFIPNPDNKPQVNHEDEVKTNNSAGNLQWCDAKYNNNHGTHNEKVAKAHINHKALSVPVVCLETGTVYPSVHEAERQTGISHSTICKCLNGKYKTAGGYHWAKFVEGDNPIYD